MLPSRALPLSLPGEGLPVLLPWLQCHLQKALPHCLGAAPPPCVPTSLGHHFIEPVAVTCLALLRLRRHHLSPLCPQCLAEHTLRSHKSRREHHSLTAWQLTHRGHFPHPEDVTGGPARPWWLSVSHSQQFTALLVTKAAPGQAQFPHVKLGSVVPKATQQLSGQAGSLLWTSGQTRRGHRGTLISQITEHRATSQPVSDD